MLYLATVIPTVDKTVAKRLPTLCLATVSATVARSLPTVRTVAKPDYKPSLNSGFFVVFVTADDPIYCWES